VSPILGTDGKPARILSVSRDTTELVAAQERLKLLNGELGHRLKNTLTMVQAIAGQTFRHATSMDEAATAFAERLTAFGKATDVLTTTAWESASLVDILASGLGVADGFRDRIAIEGGPATLPGQAGLALTLALHELATNACKYGALSNDEGRILIDWSLKRAPDGEDVFAFRWKETGGPTVIVPQSRGFGSRMIERSLGSYFESEPVLRFEPEGVEFSIEAALRRSR